MIILSTEAMEKYERLVHIRKLSNLFVTIQNILKLFVHFKHTTVCALRKKSLVFK